MTAQYFSGLERGLRGPGLTSAQQDQLDQIDSDNTALNGRVDGVETDIAATNDSLDSLSRTVADQRLTSGDLLTGATYEVSLAAGATAVQADDGTQIGFAIPAGSTGAGTFIAVRAPFSPAWLKARIGRTIEFVVLADVTPPFQTAKPLNPLAISVKRDGGSVEYDEGAVVSSAYDGNRLSRTLSYTIVGDEAEIGPVIQVVSASTANNVDLRVVALTFKMQEPANNAVSTADDSAAYRNGADLRRIGVSPSVGRVPPLSLTAGELLDDAVTDGSAVSGAALIMDGGRKVGLTFPSGQSGAGSFVQALTRFSDDDLARLTGREVVFTLVCETTDDLLSDKPLNPFALLMIDIDNVAHNNFGKVIETIAAGTTLIRNYSFTFTGNERYLGPLLQFVSRSTANTHSVRFQSFTYRLADSPEMKATSAADEMLEARLASELGAVLTNSAMVTSVTAGTSLATKNAAIEPSAVSPVEVKVPAAAFAADHDWTPSAWSRWNGMGRDFSRWHYELADSADPDLVPNTQTIWMTESAHLRGLRITGRNVRYPVHADAGGILSPGASMEVRAVSIEHLGNDGMRAYQAAHDDEPVWSSEHAWGCGTSSGWKQRHIGGSYKAPFTAFFLHNSRGADRPTDTDLEAMNLVSTGTRECQVLVPYGSGQLETVRMAGCSGSDLVITTDIWLPTEIDYQPANHIEYDVFGYANAPMVVRVFDFGQALRIASTDTATGTVSVSGSAVAVLFGEVVRRTAGGGLIGYAAGSVDVHEGAVGQFSDTYITALGKRLGDCSSASKQLVVTIDGGAPITITFNADYRASSNATILGIINAALGAAGTAVTYSPGSLYRPRFLDEEVTLKNTSAVGLPKGSACAYDADERSIRKMTAADPAWRFAGVAWEDIYPGEWGRVKFRGWLPSSDILRSDAGAFTIGQGFGIGSDGQFAADTDQLLVAVRTDAVAVKGSVLR